MEQAILWAVLAFVGLMLVLVGRNDWRRVWGARRAVLGQVVGYQALSLDDRRYSAVYRFTDEVGAVHEVADQIYTATRKPPVGTVVELVYPAGYPRLARPPRPLLNLYLYAVLLGLFAIVLARATGLIER